MQTTNKQIYKYCSEVSCYIGIVMREQNSVKLFGGDTPTIACGLK